MAGEEVEEIEVEQTNCGSLSQASVNLPQLNVFHTDDFEITINFNKIHCFIQFFPHTHTRTQVDTDAHTHMKNGKKICWNYRKGRCRFGSNCTYAHDSDLHLNKKLNEMDKDGNGGAAATAAVVLPASGIPMSQTTTLTTASTNAPNANATGVGTAAAATAGKLKTKTSNKKRPGLGDSIVPSKKVIKAYNALKK